jgi:hypothetical protein
MRIQKLLAGVFALLLLASGAQAVSYGFECITNNSMTDAAIGEAQLSVDVTFSADNTSAFFKFTNSGPAACSIAEIYFYDGTLFALNSGAITASEGNVAYSLTNVNPANLPGVSAVASSAYVIESADAGNRAPTKGVNPGESVTISLAMLAGVTAADVLAALDANDRDTFFIGLHVIAFADGRSDAFVSPRHPVPEPCMFALMGLSLIGLGGLKLRRKQ